MIYISLPGFFDFFKINQCFYEDVKKMVDKLKEPKITVSDVHGSFPYTITSGNLNSNFGQRPLYDAYVNCGQKILSPIRFDCSNIFLTPQDYEDAALEVILSCNDNGSNKIEVSSLDFYSFLKEKYPNYHYIFSANGDYLHPMTPEIINTLTEEFDLVTLPKRFKKEDMSLLKDKHKIEIIIGDVCLSNCPHYNDCHKIEQQRQLEFSSLSPLRTCMTGINNGKNYQAYNYMDEIQEYIKMGFTHFKISYPIGVSPAYHFLNLYDNFFSSDIKQYSHQRFGGKFSWA